MSAERLVGRVAKGQSVPSPDQVCFGLMGGRRTVGERCVCRGGGREKRHQGSTPEDRDPLLVER